MISVYAWEFTRPVAIVILGVVIAAFALVTICVVAGAMIVVNAICYGSNK